MAETVPADPDIRKRVEAIPLLRTLGIRLVEIGDDYAVMAVELADIHANYLGGAHGGLIATLADTVCFFPRPLLPSGLVCTTTTKKNTMKAFLLS